MNTIAKIKQVVVKLKTDTTISSLLWNRIYIWQPMSEQTQSYMTINIVTQIQNIEVNNRTRVEFRYIGLENTALDTLWDIEFAVKDFMIKNYREFGFYKFEIGTLANWYDEKKKPVLIRDFILYYIT